MFLVVSVGLYYPLLTIVGGHRVAVVVVFSSANYHDYYLVKLALLHPSIHSLFCFSFCHHYNWPLPNSSKVDSYDCIATLFSSRTHTHTYIQCEGVCTSTCICSSALFCWNDIHYRPILPPPPPPHRIVINSFTESSSSWLTWRRWVKKKRKKRGVSNNETEYKDWINLPTTTQLNPFPRVYES